MSLVKPRIGNRARGRFVMVRTVCVVLVALAMFGCSNEIEEDSAPTAASTAPPADAKLTFHNQTWDLHVTGPCGPASDGSYNTWAVTLDADGNPASDGPQLAALHEGNWSVIDFLPGAGQQIIRAYREGDDVIRFENGVLEFDGELGAGLKDELQLTLTCPE